MLRCICIGIISFIALSSSAIAGNVQLRSHQAVYAMKQTHKPGDSWSPIERADGVLRYVFKNTCDGWTVEHHTAMHMNFESGQQAQMTWSYTSWEARDGTRLRFRTRSKRNGVVVESFSGEARKEADQSIVVYSEPNGRRETMPVGTVFPTTHLIQSIKAAQNGETVFNASYFDGGGQDVDLEVSTVSTLFKGKRLTEVKGVKLPVMKTWDMMLAFFQPKSQNSQPEMEIGARYRLDGISTRLLQDFGDFTLEGQLVGLEYYDEPKCQ